MNSIPLPVISLDDVDTSNLRYVFCAISLYYGALESLSFATKEGRDRYYYFALSSFNNSIGHITNFEKHVTAIDGLGDIDNHVKEFSVEQVKLACEQLQPILKPLIKKALAEIDSDMLTPDTGEPEHLSKIPSYSADQWASACHLHHELHEQIKAAA